jgi:hypothetical protein
MIERAAESEAVSSAYCQAGRWRSCGQGAAPPFRDAGHVFPQVERVADEHDGYLVVEKVGEAGRRR